MAKKLDYHKSVNYSQADPMKVLAQKEGLATAGNMPAGFKEVEGTRGESAYVFKMPGGSYGAFVQEGLGTKSLIAQAMYEETGRTYLYGIAQDTVACIINDLVSVGATPVVLNAYWSSSSYEWLTDTYAAEYFIKGWRAACETAGVVWGGGETQSLSGVIEAGALEFAGSAFGVIADDKHLVQGKNLRDGDAIILIASSGVHANGISLIREIAGKLPQGWQTKLPNDLTLGLEALEPSYIYAAPVKALQDAGIDIHYLSNITGHGWRKLMRAAEPFSYIMTKVPPAQAIFPFIAEHSGNDQREMYGNYNMGAGYAVYLPADQAEQALKIIKKFFTAWIAGRVEKGPKKVVIEPLGITFEGDSLEVR